MPVPFCLKTWLMCHFGILPLHLKQAWGLWVCPPLLISTTERETENGDSMITVHVATCTHSCHKISNLPENTAATSKKACQCPSVPRYEDLTMAGLYEFKASQDYIARPCLKQYRDKPICSSTRNCLQLFYKTFHVS